MTALYAPWPEGARRTWALATPFVVLFAYLASALPVVIGFAVLTAVEVAGGADPETVAEDLPTRFSVLGPMILAQFVCWGLLILVWAAAFERRGPASWGLQGRGFAGRFLRGLAVGAGLVVLLGVAGAAVAALFPEAAPDGPGAEALAGFDASRLLTGEAALVFALVAGLFLVQGGTEEVVFRGWMMSSLAARWGAAAAVLLSSLVFMLFHVHVFVSGAAGLPMLLGIGATGLFFALYALAERSVVGAAAGHGAFNAVVVLSGVVAAMAADPALGFDAALSQVFEQATGMAGPEAAPRGPFLFLQLVLFGALSVIMAARLALKGSKRV